MKYAQKLDVVVPMPYLHKATVVLGRHGKGLNDFQEGVTRRYVPRKQVELVRAIVPDSIQHAVLGVNYTEVTLLAAHIHVVERCVINLYQQTNGERTTFYEGTVEPDDTWSTDNGNGYLNVNMGLLTPVESFIAQDGDVWILDAFQPHSVEVIGDPRPGMHRFEPNGDKRRFMVQIYMDLPYSEVIEQFMGATHGT